MSVWTRNVVTTRLDHTPASAYRAVAQDTRLTRKQDIVMTTTSVPSGATTADPRSNASTPRAPSGVANDPSTSLRRMASPAHRRQPVRPPLPPPSLTGLGTPRTSRTFRLVASVSSETPWARVSISMSVLVREDAIDISSALIPTVRTGAGTFSPAQ